MSERKIINCECGYVVRGEDDEQLVARAQQHLRDDHPALVGQVSDDQFLAMAEAEA